MQINPCCWLWASEEEMLEQRSENILICKVGLWWKEVRNQVGGSLLLSKHRRNDSVQRNHVVWVPIIRRSPWPWHGWQLDRLVQISNLCPNRVTANLGYSVGKTELLTPFDTACILSITFEGSFHGDTHKMPGVIRGWRLRWPGSNRRAPTSVGPGRLTANSYLH